MGARSQQKGRPLELNEGRQEAKTRKLAPPAKRLRFALLQCWLYCVVWKGPQGSTACLYWQRESEERNRREDSLQIHRTQDFQGKGKAVSKTTPKFLN